MRVRIRSVQHGLDAPSKSTSSTVHIPDPQGEADRSSNAPVAKIPKPTKYLITGDPVPLKIAKSNDAKSSSGTLSNPSSNLKAMGNLNLGNSDSSNQRMAPKKPQANFFQPPLPDAAQNP